MPEDRDRITRLEEQVKMLADDLRALVREVGGISVGNGDFKPMRRRVHDLETNTAASTAAKAALEAAEAIRRDGWSFWQKFAVTVFAGIGAVGTIVSTVVLVRGR